MRSIGLPNYITLSRFLIIPLIALSYIREEYGYSLLLVLLAGFTDLLDGILARALGMRSRLGTILDPAADKLLMLVTFLSLGWMHRLPVWVVALVIGRDIYIVLGVFFLKMKCKKLYVRPTYLSKMTTFFQISLLFFSIIYSYLEAHPLPWVLQWAPLISLLTFISFYLGVLFTLMSGLHYSLIGWMIYRGKIKET